LGGLLDWHGHSLPTPADIAGARVLAQGAMHIKAITTTGGAILGNRSLDADAIEPALFLEAGYVRRAFTLLRPAGDDADKRLPKFSTWGYNVIRVRAEKHFLR
jgi:hypothetical protein